MNRIAVSKALNNDIVLTLIQRIMSLTFGFITILIISIFLPATLQGYYYTFLSLIGIQAFLELGFFIIITNFSSHEWSNLHLDSQGFITGDTNNLSRLVSFGRFIFFFYGVLSILFIIIVGAVGFIIFKNDPPSIWKYPWMILVLFSGLNLFFLPFISMLEGCGQIRNMLKFRILQLLISNILLWGFLAAGFGLWAFVISSISIFARDLYLFLFRYRNFFLPFINYQVTVFFKWKTEVWPLQWKLAVQAIFGYFMIQFITPVVFHFEGVVAAGKVGMSMQIIFAIQALGNSLLATKAVGFGGMVARNDFSGLNFTWKKYANYSLALLIMGGASFVLLLYLMQILHIKWHERVIVYWQFGLLVIAQFLSQVIQTHAFYLRAFKKERFVFIGIVSGTVAFISIWYLTSIYNTTGAVYGYLLTMIVSVSMSYYIFTKHKRIA